MMKVLKNKFKTASQKDLTFFLWILPAWCLLGLSRLAVLTVPFKNIAHVLGTHDGLEPRTPICEPIQELRALSLSQAIRFSARHTPWQSNCFPQAITARIILKLYKIPFALFFGLKRDHKFEELQAHAWVVSGRINVTGGRSFRDFTSVGCFVYYGK